MRYNRGVARCGLLVVGILLGTVPAGAQGRRYSPFDGFTPGVCAIAPPIIDSLSRLNYPDTTAYAPRNDTLWRSTTDSIRICDAVYQGLTREDRDLLNLARVKLARGDDAAAAAARQRYLATLASRPVREQAWAYYLMILDNLEAKPPRLSGAQQMLERLDHLAMPEARKASFLAHASIADGAYRVWDESLAQAEANRAIAQYRQLTMDQQVWFSWPAAMAFEHRAEQALRLAGIGPAKAILDTAGLTIPHESYGYGGSGGILDVIRLYATLGQVAAPIEAKFWFRASDTVPRPAQGRVTVINVAEHLCGHWCNSRYRTLGRYVTRFGRQGFELINTAQTWGFYADTAPVAPRDEAQYDSLYFLGIKRLPGMLAVAETQYRWRASDGRRLNTPSPQRTNYPEATFVLVDKRGIVRYVAFGLEPILEEPIARLIERLLAEPERGAP